MRNLEDHRRAGVGRAFTLLEVIVAIAAVALIGLGLARVFSATGDTVRAGRRISNFNEYAAMLERIMREDFRRMSREGYLVIGHELTEEPVRRFRDDRFSRRRRIDQIMFFASGEYHTQRAPLHPSRVAGGSTARIWYGHGLRQFSPDQGDPPAVPRVNDTNAVDDVDIDGAPYFGEPALGTGTGPNEYAVDWILLRSVAVLVQPKTIAPPRPNTITFPTSDQWEDNDIQVDLQPAQSSLFRNLARGTPATLPGLDQIARPFDGQVYRPLVSSGLVDLITTDLSEIRAIILDAQGIASNNPAKVFDPEEDSDGLFGDFYEWRSLHDPNLTEDRSVPYAFQPDPTPDGNRACLAMKNWMLQGLPAEPRVNDSTNRQPDRAPGLDTGIGGRMRCELVPPDYLGSLANNGAVYINNEDYRRTDQYMLSAHNFAPACTEFIVEWSFGEVYKTDTDPSSLGRTPDPFLSGLDDPRAGQLIWHGLKRYADLDFRDGAQESREDQIAAPYLGYDETTSIGNADDPIDAHYQLIPLSNGKVERRILPARVIHEPVNSQGEPDPQDGEPFYSIFGYVDPTFEGPLKREDITRVQDWDKQFRPDTIPCPWPRLIRVTMTLADPADPEFEQTYQFIFEVPERSVY